MTQPTFADGPPVPLLTEGVIDCDTLRQLFDDIAAAATVLTLRTKGGPAEYTSSEDPSPALALEQIRTGAVRAVQVRYRFADHEWTDTVFAMSTGFRVVRCRHDS